jgi:hypothetical protein
LEGSAFGRLTPMNLNWALRRILRQVQELHFNVTAHLASFLISGSRLIPAIFKEASN